MKNWCLTKTACSVRDRTRQQGHLMSRTSVKNKKVQFIFPPLPNRPCMMAHHFTSFSSFPLSSDTRLTSGSQHPSGDHYKFEVTTCTLQSLHRCFFLQQPGTAERSSTSPHSEQNERESASWCFPWRALVCGTIKRSRVTAGNSHRKWRCTASSRVPLQVIYLDRFHFFKWESPFFHSCCWIPRVWEMEAKVV